MIQKLSHGYRWTSGQQDGHLTITRVGGGIKFRETHGTREIRKLPGSCHRVKVRTGVAAVCSAGSASAGNPMKLEIVPRLGDDVVDGRTLPAAFKLSVLADAGNDVVRGGAGDDFVNGAFGVDRVYGGAGNDWLRTGDAGDHVFGGPGNDRVVGVDGNDEVRGGSGNDLVQGGNGRDAVHGDSGKDTVSCGGGSDAGYGDRYDTIRACERVSRRG
jgi:serralysin